jgi:Na+/proline symporter
MIIGVVVIETLLAAVSVIGSGIHWTDIAFVNAFKTNEAMGFPPGPIFTQEVVAQAAGAMKLVHDDPTTETIILQVAFENLPAIMGALLLAGGVAIILSTGNTFLMVPATNLTRDIYQRFIKPDADDRTIILFQRASIAVLGIVALLLATQFTTILAMAFTAYTMVGAGITPALLAAFLWRRTTTAGGVSSIVSGMSVTVFITIVNWFHQRSHDEPFLETDYIIIPAATASLLALVIVSLLTAKPPREKWEPFYSTQEEPTAA